MYRKMLVLLDGSELAEVVLPYASGLAGRLDVEAILLQVLSHENDSLLPMHRAYIEKAADIVRHGLEETGEKSSDQKSIKVECKVAQGYPADEILRFSQENNIDFILMASHGRSGVRQYQLGSVADKILRTSKIPVLLVRAGQKATPYNQWPSTNLIVPMDGSQLAESVLPHVEALAGKHSSRPVNVILLWVCEPILPSYYTTEFTGASINWGQYVEREMAKCQQSAKDYLASTESRLKSRSIDVRSVVLLGRAADEIVDYAGKIPYSLIVMATHGRSGLGRWVFGSVAERVLQGVDRPIFLVR